MSHEAMTWAVKQATGSPARKAVLLNLANRADEAWSCFPSQTRIAQDTELGVRTVRRALDDLIDLGLIARERRRRGDGTWTSDRFVLSGADIDHRPQRPEVTEAASHSGPIPVNPPATAATRPPATAARHELSLEPLTVTKVPTTSERAGARPTPSADADATFDAFWADCPRKVGKDAARRAWKAAIRRAGNPRVIHDGLRAHLPAWATFEPQYIPHPSTWLNEGRWQDDPPEPRLTPGETRTVNNLALVARFEAEEADQQRRAIGQ